MFFINLGKKIIRGVGIAVCVLLAALCVLMMVTSAAFGSAQTVSVFGFNMFICESGDYDTVPAGSAVITTSCAPYDLEEGNLVLYSTDPMDKNAALAMGYYADFKMTDGVYYLSLVNGSESTIISENALVGKAGWCSPFLGEFISFTKTPWGVFVMAVIPCALLLLFDLLRRKSAEQPIPEIIPQVKNRDEEHAEPQISVGESGSASYRRNAVGKQQKPTADSVLFTFDNKKSSPKSSSPTMSDAAVLSLLNSPASKQEKSADKPEQKEKVTAGAVSQSSGKATLPAPVAAKRYIDNTVTPVVKPGPKPVSTAETKPKKPKPVAEKTEELPELPKKQKRPDAFFTQSEAPQIGKGLTGRQSRSIIDLEDALATAPARGSKSESTRRSADILAAKNRRDLITEDDDSRDKSRYEVDDILAGIERRHQE
ncbi:MAG: hypothetical protein ACI4WS_14595 [Oscillospiraceae bacterium]